MWSAVACGLAVACVLLGGAGGAARPAPQFYRVQEYFIEHEVSSHQAREALQHVHNKTSTPAAGCKECTQNEIRYCLGPQLINDHCCCDRRYQEHFPYVPHTCYLGEKLCEPLAKDCAEYTRLRTCCCDRYVLEKWKMKSSGPKFSDASLTSLLLSVVMSYVFGYR